MQYLLQQTGQALQDMNPDSEETAQLVEEHEVGADEQEDEGFSDLTDDPTVVNLEVQQASASPAPAPVTYQLAPGTSSSTLARGTSSSMLARDTSSSTPAPGISSSMMARDYTTSTLAPEAGDTSADDETMVSTSCCTYFIETKASVIIGVISGSTFI